MPPAGFEPTISAGERPQTYALDRADTGTGIYVNIVERSFNICNIYSTAKSILSFCLSLSTSCTFPL